MTRPSRRTVLASGAAAAVLWPFAARAQVTTRPLAPECRGHGCFLYDPEETVARYGSPQGIADALVQANMQHAWVRLHDVEAVVPYDLTRRIIEALRTKNIKVAGYGWCHGKAPVEEARLGVTQMKAHGLSHYIANIEQGKKKGAYGKSNWSVPGIEAYCKAFRSLTPANTNLLISTYPFIGVHSPELMRAASPYVDAFAPQVYWYRYPAAWMWPRSDVPAGASYGLNEPAEYARLCLDMWRYYTDKPLLITGQAYWSVNERTDFDLTDAEMKMRRFVETFDQYSRIIGLNWWHLGSRSLTIRGGAMTENMHQVLVGANLNNKPFVNT